MGGRVLSTYYYLCDRRKREEVEAFNQFWEFDLIPGMEKQINDYCNNLAGTCVNSKYADFIIQEKLSNLFDTPLLREI